MSSLKGMIPIIVFGENGYNTLGVVRALGIADLQFYLILINNLRLHNYVALSKYVKNCQCVNNVKEGLEYILQNLRRDEKSVIIPTSDRIESELDENYDRLITDFIFPNAGGQGQVIKLMNKMLMGKIASECGISVPWSIEYDKTEKIPGTISYPCLVKTINSINTHGKRIKRCDSETELRTFISQNYDIDRFLIQQYINKEYDVLVIGCRNMTGETYLPAIFKKERWFLDGDDGSFGIVSSDVNKYVNTANFEKFLSAINYSGPFSIELGVIDGKAFLYEINLRNDGTSHYFLTLGINMQYLWIASLCDDLIRPKVTCETQECYFIDEFGDILNVFRGKITLTKWYRDLKRANAFKYYNKLDKKPLRRIIPYMVSLITYKLVKIILHRI